VKRDPGWAARLVWLVRGRENVLVLPGIRPQFLSPPSGSFNLVLAEVTKLLQNYISIKLVDQNVHVIFVE
jgi:hypothetical protein